MSSTAVLSSTLDRTAAGLAATAARSAGDWRDLVLMPGPGIVRFW